MSQHNSWDTILNWVTPDVGNGRCGGKRYHTRKCVEGECVGT